MPDTTIKERLERLVLLAEVSDGLSALREDLAGVARDVAARDAETARLRRHLAYLLDRGDALAAAARHCAHACVPPCPHTRKVAAVLETWDATSDLSRTEGAGAGASRERSDPAPSGLGSGHPPTTVGPESSET